MEKVLKIISVFFFLIFTSAYVIGQENNNTPAIKMLGEGILIVRLDMQKNKINAYKKSLSSNKLKDKDAERMSKNLKALIIEREEYKSNVIEAFTQLYTFSRLAFIENHEFKEFIEGGDVNIITNETTKALLESKVNLFYLIKGRHDAEWIIVNNNFQRPAHPFPNAFGIGFKKFFDLFTGEENYSIKNQRKLAQKIDKSLIKFDSKWRSS